ncbi:DNA-dependent metalloprotease SPRTN [Diabrotica virgifera virgifera]|uniref:Protein with SprT-like domain at the N terminus n=1 Tax=Diabrotica virgifera virgifera TaxID=50390 RepID=A0ABM5L3U8_DIAVI|nr:DNA-dependent metalloprotease SPRTN [Diabrotica virgifera virgifera]
MAELDYQTALLLQNKFEQEKRDSQIAKELQRQFEKENVPNNREQNRRSSLNDSLLARSLQEQFQTEMEVERPQQNLVYDAPNGRNSGKSLTDPSWEVIDPTPDIHMLFIAFNERFFWNQLGSVTVSWSKRMTTCAGICSYQGRGGMCTITLSEPLLKLRPRKDLVETLLHEMIHAYLFVTNNNRDRDGHGPEFHRHMNRINQEAGTKITVYHNFHDEVNLYKTHWWRCNGPCHTRKPFFGLVRRATNRAPCPNDFWWAEHQQNCGGQFIKVKEPEKPEKQTKSKSASKNPTKSPDIRKFFPSKNLPKSKSDNNSNVKTVETKNESKAKINKVIPNSGNIFGFGNLNGEDCNCDKNGTNTKDNKAKKIVSTAGKTLGTKNPDGVSTSGKTLGTKNPPDSVSKISKGVLRRTKSESANNVSKNDQTKSTPAKPTSNGAYDVVRNHWINKFSNTSSTITKSNTTTPWKRPKPSESARPVTSGSSTSTSSCSTSATKVPKLSEPVADCSPIAKPNTTSPLKRPKLSEPVADCSPIAKPNTTTPLKRPKLSEPVDCSPIAKPNTTTPLKRPKPFESALVGSSKVPKLSEPVAECPVCSKQVPEYKINSHLDECLGTSELESTKCHTCGIVVAEGKLEEHLQDCNDDVVFLGVKRSEDENTLDNSQEDRINSDNSVETKKCDICKKLVGS